MANDTSPVNTRAASKYRGESSAELFARKRESLVDILAYSLMPNHFHIVARQLAERGISIFMGKLCTGYSMYFNRKHDHSGTLFQGPFKSSHIDTDSYFLWSFAYAHLNPLSLVEPEWSGKHIRDSLRAQKFLEKYRYSSYPDYYCGKRPERTILNYEEGLNHVDSNADMRALLKSYARGRVLYTSFTSA
ncbi:MAG: transposase [bacterium]|nr:transposase [bacterium]